MAEQLKGVASGAGNTLSSGVSQTATGAQSAASGVGSTAAGGASAASASAADGAQKWEAMTEEQKKQAFDSLPEDQKKGKTSYLEWIKEGYHKQVENWWPWIEDQYLKWFTKDNKASYATKDTLGKTKVTGIQQVDTLQDGVHNLVGGQVGQGGLLQPVGDALSKEGINRAERGGKDESGSYLGSAGNTVSSAGGSVVSGAKSAGGYVGGLFGGGKKTEGAEQK